MRGTSETVTFSWLFFATHDWSKYLNTRKRPFKMEFKDVLFRKLFRRFMHSPCKNVNIPI